MAGFLPTNITPEAVRRVGEASRAEARLRFLNLRRLPELCDDEEVSWLGGWNREEVSLLVRYGLLMPVGNPASNGKKRFASAEVLALGADLEWLRRAASTIIQHWKAKNGTEKQTQDVSSNASEEAAKNGKKHQKKRVQIK